jgi:microcystin-dependent protein
MSEPFIGEIKMFAGNFAPRGYALCNGQLLPISQNAALFSLLGTTYGGNGQVTFGLPDLRGRTPVHQGQGPGLSSYAMGEATGEENHTLIAAEMALHNHTQMASTNTATAASGPSAAPGASATTMFYGNGAPQVAMAASAVTAAGGNQPHDNMAPFQVLNFIIALQGIFPARN